MVLKSLLRVPTYLLLLLYMLLGLFIGLYTAEMRDITVSVYIQLAVASVMIAGWYINGTSLNDYQDYEIDMINLKGDPDRPIITGLASRTEVLAAAIVSGVVSLILATILSWNHALLIMGLLVLNASYSLRPFQISRRGGLAPLVLPLGYILLPFLAGYLLVNSSPQPILWLLVAAYYLHFIGRIILKDYRDVKGDAAHGKRTFLLRHGNKAVCALAGLAISSGGLLSVYAMREFIGPFQYTIITLVTFGLTILWRLSETEGWKLQKPLLAAFGRSMTGVTAATLLAFVAYLNSFSSLLSTSLAIGITAIYMWSAYGALMYNSFKESHVPRT